MFTMLQISTGKFFKHEAYETLRRAIYYTNYRVFRDDRIETQVGSLQPVVGVHGLGALTCEIIERIQKLPGGPYSGEVIATGGETLINDFAAVVSFACSGLTNGCVAGLSAPCGTGSLFVT